MEHEDGLTQQIWDGLLDIEREIRYCHRLSERSVRFHKWLSGALVAASVGVAAPLLSPLPDFVAGFFFAAVVVIGIWTLLADYATTAAVCRLLGERYQDLKQEWKTLWFEGGTQADINALMEKCQRVGANVYIPQNEALNKRITKEAYQTLPFEFGQRL